MRKVIAVLLALAALLAVSIPARAATVQPLTPYPSAFTTCQWLDHRVNSDSAQIWWSRQTSPSVATPVSVTIARNGGTGLLAGPVTKLVVQWFGKDGTSGHDAWAYPNAATGNFAVSSNWAWRPAYGIVTMWIAKPYPTACQSDVETSN